MQGRDDVSAFLSAFAGSQRHVLDYLVAEVLLPPPIRRGSAQPAEPARCRISVEL
jgi:hypothetical protein